MKLAIIANPAAGRGRTKVFIERIMAQAAVRDLHASCFFTERPGHAEELARTLSPENDTIVVIGGDGTVHEVVNGMMPDPAPLAIIPTGSGNDFAKLVGCAGDMDELVELLEKGYGAMLDVLDLGFRYCINSAGLGFEAQVTAESRQIKNLRGIPLYLLATFKALLSPSSADFTITLADGEVIEGEKLLISIGNGVSAGGGFFLTPSALPDDGIIDLCIAGPMNRVRLLGLLPAVLRGGHVNKRGVRMIKTEAVTIESQTPFHLHIDGEYMGKRKWRLPVSVIERKLPVICCGSKTRFARSLEKILA